VGKRRKGREIVLQSMYASLISGAQLVDTLEDQLLQRESADETQEFARDLTKKVKTHAAELDRWLTSIAEAIVFLCKPAASGINGAIINVNGANYTP